MTPACSPTQLKQWVARENRARRGKPQAQKTTVQELKNMVCEWKRQQAASFQEAKLTELMLVDIATCNPSRLFIGWTCRGFLNHLRGKANTMICLTVDGKQKISTSGAVIATVGIMATSRTARNTTADRTTLQTRTQLQLRTSTVLPIMQAYMEGESTENWTQVFETLITLVKSEFKFDLRDCVLQVHADFNDSIEAARRQVFSKSRPANDYPHMMRAAQSTLGKKTTPQWRQRVLHALRCTRHLPTLELFNSVWKAFFQELRAHELTSVISYLEKEYVFKASVENLRRQYGLRSSPDMPKMLFWSGCWVGVLGIHPGSATGAQTIEAFHSFWQKQVQRQARAAPTKILEVMQTLFDGPWKTWVQNDAGREFRLLNGQR